LLLSHAPSTYKIPSIQDTPRVFNVDLIPNEGNTVNIRGTKAVGEPPLLLAISVWTAIKNAIHYKTSSGTKAHELTQSLDIPATAEANLRQLHPEAFARYEDSRAGLPRG
jgi:xanthine dehydrogenase large subunit